MEQSKILNGKACDSEKTIFFNITTKKNLKKYETFVKYHMNVESPFFILKKFNFCTRNKAYEKTIGKIEMVLG